MQIISYVDIFTMPKGIHEAMCVTTNGMIKNNGEAVMGRGIAKSVNDRYHVARKLADHLRANGNTACDLGVYDGFHLLTYPTKYDWRDNSDVELIKKSAKELMVIADRLELTRVYVPKPGCANGHLNWELQVKPAIETILDDRFVVIV